MEPLNNSLKNIMQFILCIQDACDEHRKCMEFLWQQEYSSYINEWKPCQSESKVSYVKNSEVKSHSASNCVQMSQDDKIRTETDLEFVLADTLLEKARNIRSKNKKLINGLVNCKNLCTCCTEKVDASVCCNLKHISEKFKTRKYLPLSKSDFAINNHECHIIPRSKSANMSFMQKNSLDTFCDSKSCIALSSKTNVAKCTISSINKTSKDFAVISNKDLDTLKNLQLNLPSSSNSKEKKVAQFSDDSEKRYQHRTLSHPSSTEFLNLIKDKLNAISTEVKLKTWYPFLSSKSDAFLTLFKCNSFSSIEKNYRILCSIQETMMWIDLLHLLETEICPNLIVDITDVNSLRIYNYLHSMHHPNLKRTPIIFPIKQKKKQ